MNIRNIVMVGCFAAGAALAFAPCASADDLTTTLAGEIASMNAIFEGEAALAGDSADVIKTAGSFDTIPLTDAPDTAPFTTLDYELYGIDPNTAGPSSDPGAYDVFNGALVEFSDAYNTAVYDFTNDQALIPVSDLLGSADTISAALANGTDAAAFGFFFDAGLADLGGLFDIPL